MINNKIKAKAAEGGLVLGTGVP